MCNQEKNKKDHCKRDKTRQMKNKRRRKKNSQLGREKRRKCRSCTEIQYLWCRRSTLRYFSLEFFLFAVFPSNVGRIIWFSCLLLLYREKKTKHYYRFCFCLKITFIFFLVLAFLPLLFLLLFVITIIFILYFQCESFLLANNVCSHSMWLLIFSTLKPNI